MLTKNESAKNSGHYHEEKAVHQLKQVISKDANHMFAAEMLGWLGRARDTSSEGGKAHHAS